MKAAVLCLALAISLDAPILWPLLTLILLGSHLAKAGAKPVTPRAGSSGGRCLPCAIACSAFGSLLFLVDLVAMNNYQGEFKGKV